MSDDERLHRLPPAVDLGRADVASDPDAAIARGEALMEQSAPVIVAAVETHGTAYLVRRATEVLDAWGRVPPSERADAIDRLQRAATAASARVVAELTSLFSAGAVEQVRTPLEVVRSLRKEPTAVLGTLGVPAIERDAFEERALPDDRYGLAPRTLADLGDADAAPMLLAWGVGKATVLRARASKGERVRAHSQKGVDKLSISTRGVDGERSGLGTMQRIARAAVRAVRGRVRRGDGGTG
jgi:hypothetical protein